MKKILTIILSSILLLSATGCGNKAELEALRAENEELKKQISSFPTPRPLNLRNELLDEIQKEHAIISKYLPSEISDETADIRRDMMALLTGNLTKQTEIISGINGEENFNSLVKEVEKMNEEYKTLVDSGNKTEADELMKQIHIILYGNEKGKKTWD